MAKGGRRWVELNAVALVAIMPRDHAVAVGAAVSSTARMELVLPIVRH